VTSSTYYYPIGYRIVNCRRLNYSHLRRDATKLDGFVASVSAECIGFRTGQNCLQIFFKYFQIFRRRQSWVVANSVPSTRRHCHVSSASAVRTRHISRHIVFGGSLNLWEQQRVTWSVGYCVHPAVRDFICIDDLQIEIDDDFIPSAAATYFHGTEYKKFDWAPTGNFW